MIVRLENEKADCVHCFNSYFTGRGGSDHAVCPRQAHTAIYWRHIGGGCGLYVCSDLDTGFGASPAILCFSLCHGSGGFAVFQSGGAAWRVGQSVPAHSAWDIV